MEEALDQVRINFRPEQLQWLNLCLAFLMFGVAIDIRMADFRRVAEWPRSVLAGLAAQWLLLPLLTWGLIQGLALPPSLGLGMALIAACPGGNVSNFNTHLAGGNAALSVTLTAIVSLAAIANTPLIFALLADSVPGAEALRAEIRIAPADMLRTMLGLIAMPLLAGMALRHWAAPWADRLSRPLRALSVLIFVGFVLLAFAGNWSHFVAHVGRVFWIVLLHNGLALLLGYATAKAAGLDGRDARAISIETGIQNTGLGLVIVFAFFDGLGGMAIMLAWWGIWHLISGLALALWWRRRPLP